MSKKLQFQGEIREIRTNRFTRKKNKRLSHKNFQNNAVSKYSRNFFNISFQTEIYYQGKFQKLTLLIYYIILLIE